jgi:predicted outer membrane repeat protein
MLLLHTHVRVQCNFINNTSEDSFGSAINAGSNDASIIDTALAVVNATSCLFHSNTAGKPIALYNLYIYNLYIYNLYI